MKMSQKDMIFITREGSSKIKSHKDDIDKLLVEFNFSLSALVSLL